MGSEPGLWGAWKLRGPPGMGVSRLEPRSEVTLQRTQEGGRHWRESGPVLIFLPFARLMIQTFPIILRVEAYGCPQTTGVLCSSRALLSQ